MERHVAAEFPHLVVEVDALDQPIVNPPTPLDLELSRAQPHERVSLLDVEIATTEARLAQMRAQLANEQKALAAFAEQPNERVGLLEAGILTTEARLAEIRARMANEKKAVQVVASVPHPQHEHGHERSHEHNAPTPETTPAKQASSPTEPASSEKATG